MPQHPSPMSNFLPPDVIRACVVVGDVNTPYFRTGRGEPVLLLTDDAELAATTLATLPRDYRIIAPLLFPSGAAAAAVPRDFDAWLPLFLDALGVQSAML